MFLAIDIGNSKIKIGSFKNNTLINIQRFDNVQSANNFILSSSAKEIGISSVVPQKTKELLEEIKKSSIKSFIISRDLKFNLKLNYDSIETLGIDRICSAEGAYLLFKNGSDFINYNENIYLISIDLGTALTINVINYPGEFSGGLIIPGAKMMFTALTRNTAQLPETNLSDYKNFIGKTTTQSIASGVLNSAIGAIERTINYIQTELKAEELRIYITGGNAERILPHLKFKFEHIKGLVLYGIKAIYEKNVH